MEEHLEELRPSAFALAYRMLGSIAEAEDVVQEALLRLHRAHQSGEEIRSPRAYLATVTTRLAIDELRSARVRREEYVGDWLPAPLLTDEAHDPGTAAERSESISLAFLVLLESLTPQQRAVFLLRDVFDYPYAEIAAILDRNEAAIRQIASRARRRIEEGRPRFEASRDAREHLAARFFAAIEDGELSGLEALLASDITLHGDGGGKVPALARAVHGAEAVARTLLAWAGAASRGGGWSLRRADVNGQPGGITLDTEGRIIGVLALDVHGGRIRAIRSIVNPEKLSHLGAVADLAALLARGGRRRRSSGARFRPDVP